MNIGVASTIHIVRSAIHDRTGTLSILWIMFVKLRMTAACQSGQFFESSSGLNIDHLITASVATDVWVCSAQGGGESGEAYADRSCLCQYVVNGLYFAL